MFKPFPPPQGLLDFIARNNKFLIAGHKEPDGDCVGSQLALSSALKRLGKETICCSAGPFKRTELIPYQNQFKHELSDTDKKGAVVIVVDCSMPERTGDIKSAIDELPFVMIDHHATGTPCGEITYINGNAPSTTVLIYSLIISLNLSLTVEEAEFLFFGLATDTGFFRHIDDGGAETYRIAALLIDAGANPKKTFAQINGGKTLNSRALMGTVLAKAESYFGGRLILSAEKYEETMRFGMESRDSDTLYQLLQSIDGVEAIAIIRQESPENCTVGLRSRDDVDVSAVARTLGGGGHKNAAGVLKEHIKIAEIKPVILAEFEKIFSQR